MKKIKETLSAIHGYVDRLYINMNKNGLFQSGWGDIGLTDEVVKRSKTVSAGAAVVLNIVNVETKVGYDIHHGHFYSSVDLLPEALRKVPFIIVTPPGKKPLEGRICISLPGSGDTEFNRRLKHLAIPLAAQGINTMIFQTAFYGLRKKESQKDHLIEHVSDFLLMFYSIVEEVKSIAASLLQSDHNKLCITGVSMGAHACALAGIQINSPRVALVPILAPSTVADEYAFGNMSKLIDWSALAKNSSIDNARQKMKTVLSIGDLINFEKPNCQSINVVSGSYDAYISKKNSSFFQNVWDVNIAWVNMGHITSILFSNAVFVKAISNALPSTDSI